MSKTHTKFAALALATLAASAASATIVTATLTGNSENINDTSGVFGAPGGRITDQAFIQVFTIDTKGGNARSDSTGVSFNSALGAGGPYAVGGKLTVNGHSFTTLGNNYSFVSSGGDYQITSDDLPQNANPMFSLDLHGAGLPTTVTAAAALTIDGTNLSAFDSFIDYKPATGADSQGTLTPTSVTIAVSNVPEPATLGLAALGLGAVALRIRKAR